LEELIQAEQNDSLTPEMELQVSEIKKSLTIKAHKQKYVHGK
jgi:hypothetical protein